MHHDIYIYIQDIQQPLSSSYNKYILSETNNISASVQ